MRVLTRLLFLVIPIVLLAGCKNTPPSASASVKVKRTDPAQLKRVAKSSEQDAAEHNSTAPGPGSADPALNGDLKPVADLTSGPAWPHTMGEFSARSRDRIPPFPAALSGFRSEKGKDYEGKPYPATGTVRVEDGNDWKGLKHFPKTRYGCSYGVFMLRWRVSDPVIRVYSTIDNPRKSTANVATGNYGYMQGSVCDKPQFKFGSARKPNWSNHVDVFYEVKFWEATP